MDIRKLIEAMSEAGRRSRSNYHLTLGGLRDALDAAPDDLPVFYDDGAPVGDAKSYRGYYTDIALSDAAEPRTVAEMRVLVAEWLKTTFEGYKGGDYPASPDKPLWRSGYGTSSGVAIMGWTVDGDGFVLTTKLVD